jgi:hypothetical protein
MVKRFQIVKAVQVIDEIVPIWDKRLKYDEDDYFGNRIYDSKTNHYCTEVIDVVYDVKNKKLSLGEELNKYPKKEHLKFKKGDAVFYEVELNKLRESKIMGIVFEEYEVEVLRGDKLIRNYREYPKVDIEPKKMYMLKIWKPWYILEDGTRVMQEYQLYHKA